MYSIRPATIADSVAIADLLVQLAHAEAPGLFTGPVERQRQLVLFTLVYENGDDLRHRWVVVDQHNQVVGTGAAHIPGTPPSVPVSLDSFRAAVNLLGLRASLRLATTLSIDLLASHLATPKRPRNSLYVYGVCTQSSVRRSGVGKALMLHMEQLAHEYAIPLIQVRIIQSNHQALRFYQHLNYAVVGSTPRWLAPFAFSTLILQKPVLSVVDIDQDM